MLYAQEYGWDWTYEALISKILGEFAANFDPSKEDGWIAERAGEIVGSIFLRLRRSGVNSPSAGSLTRRRRACVASSATPSTASAST